MNHNDMETMTMDHDDSDVMMHGSGMMHMGNLKQKFWISLILTIPVLLMSEMMGVRLPFAVTFPGSDWVVAIIGTILFFYGGAPFFSGARGELQEKKPAMMTLITMGIAVAYIYSIYAVIANNLFHVTPMVMSFFWELATLIDIMLLGHWVEMNAVMKAGSAVNQLANLLPDTAHIVDEQNQVHDLSLSDLHEGQVVEVRAGERIPADGQILTGSSSVNEALVTGESKAIKKSVGDEVIGGAVNGDGTLRITVTGTGDTGYLAKVAALVDDAQNKKSAKQNMSDRVAGALFYAALIVGILAFIIWLTLSGLTVALPIAVTVFVIACPHALGLAIPLVVARSTSIAANHGLLIHNRDALEAMPKVRYVLMDKTGTLTEGQFKVAEVKSLSNDMTNDEVLSTMAALEAGSSHPLAVGIIQAAKDRQLVVPQAENPTQITGQGISGQIESTAYSLVKPSALATHRLKPDVDFDQQMASQGNSISYLIDDHQVLGVVAQGDLVKPAAKQMVAQLKTQELTPVMVTGDNQATAENVAQRLGIGEVRANLVPEEKAQVVNQMMDKGGVMYVGDGVNDAPSLASATVGVAIGSGTDVAIDSADVVLVRSDPKDIIDLVELGKRTSRKMTENLWWGAGYNIIAIPLAAGVLAFAGILLNPLVGAILMSFSTIIVALNALTLKIRS